MKQYQKALVIINEQAKASSKHNKLVKLEVETEEQEFKEVLKNLIKVYSLYIEPRYSRSFGIPMEERTEWHVVNHGHWKELSKKYNTLAIEFLEDRIAQGKPQWQIIAEKNGWAPK